MAARISRTLLAELGVVVPPAGGRAASKSTGDPVWLALIRAWCLSQSVPLPETEHEFARESLGRLWRFDLCWPGHSVALEVEGVTRHGGRHQRVEGLEEDAVKYSWAAILGWTLIRATPRMIQDGRVWPLLEAAFRCGRAATNGG